MVATLEAVDIMGLMKLLPHRYPFLLIDRIVDIDGDESAVGIKNVTINEPHFQGHFPQQPVMPGVLIIEAMAQAACFLSIKSRGQENDGNSVYYFVGIDGARFKRPVVPGDQLRLEVELLAMRRGLFKYSAVAKVDGQVASEAELLCTERRLDETK